MTSSCFNDSLCGLRRLIGVEVRRHLKGIPRETLAEFEDGDLLQGAAAMATDPGYQREALRALSALLHRVHGQPVVILIDEYDTPVHAAWQHGYYDELMDFMRGLLSGAFKDNPHAFKCVITGILRVARESVFSGLNNLKV